MFKKAFIAIVLLSCTLLQAQGENDRTYKTLRAVSATDDTGYTAAGTYLTTVPAEAVEVYGYKRGPNNENRGTQAIVFRITNATGETATWSLWGMKNNQLGNTEGPTVEFVAYGTATAGSTVTNNAGEYWANAITVTGQAWNSPLKVVPGIQYNLGTGLVANGGIAKLILDSCEYKYFIMKMAKGTCATMGADVGTYISESVFKTVEIDGTITTTGITDTELRASEIAVVQSGPTKTSAFTVADAWKSVAVVTIDTGAAIDLSTAYGGILNIQVGLNATAAHSGGDIGDVEWSVDGNPPWNFISDITLTPADTAATTTINDAAVTAGDRTITLTDATTGDFDVKGRFWFLLDGTIENSEVVETKTNASHTVTLVDPIVRSHANGLSVYDRGYRITVMIDERFPFVRAKFYNTDADCTIAKQVSYSKISAR